MSFQSIKGQNNAIGFLKQAIRNGRLAGAYLFVGPPGVGKALTAKALAAYLLCAKPSQEIESCAVCPSCLAINKLLHPDLIWLKPEGKAAMIHIDQIRFTQERLATTSLISSKKICVIEDAEEMNEEAANCLLKILEEPPRETFFILTSAKISKLYPTIISRCQKIIFHALKIQEVEKMLQSDLGLSEAEAYFLSRLAQGSPGLAQRFCAEKIFQEKDALLSSFFKLNYFFDEANAQTRQSLEKLLHLLLSWYRDLFLLQVGTSELWHRERADALAKLKGRVGFEEISRKIEAVILAQSYLERRLSPKLIMGNLALELSSKLAAAN
jgi:DNA polymerase-3 subunit delta'